MNCRLCEKNLVEKFCENSTRTFYRCSNCELIFVPQNYFLSLEEEKARYDLHYNSIGNKGYVNYLETIVRIVSDSVPRNESIIDFGSGENAVLTELLKNNGYDCTAYDPLYGREVNQDRNSFDIVIACEVMEHLRDLRKELSLIRMLLKDSFRIIIRTQISPSNEQFLKWWYIQDLTHVNFFSLKSLEIISKMLDCDLEMTDKSDIFIFHRRRRG
jgi:hypothetical protein